MYTDFFCHNKISFGKQPCHLDSPFIIKYQNPKVHNQWLDVTTNDIDKQCVTFNPHGNLSVPYTGFDHPIKLKIYPKVEHFMAFRIQMHDFEGSRVAPRKMSAGRYEFQVKERIDIRRLASPYPSNCTDGKGLSMFPGRYTQEKCKDTCLIKALLKNCSNVPDMFKSLLTEKDKRLVLDKPDILKCWRDTYINFYGGPDGGDGQIPCDCPLSCHDVSYDYDFITQEKWDSKKNNVTEIDLRASLKKVYMIELPAYPLTKFFADIGGWLALIVGMSALSVVEIVTYFALRIFVYLPSMK